MKKFKEYLGEAFFKVKIPDIAPTFVEAGSEAGVKMNMRKIMKPDAIKDLEIERVTPAAMKQMYRDMAAGKEKEKEVDEDKKMDVIEIDDALAIRTCKMYNYKYAVITPNDIVIPPSKDDNFSKD